MQGMTWAAYLKSSFQRVSGHTQRVLRTQGMNGTLNISPALHPSYPKDVSLRDIERGCFLAPWVQNGHRRYAVSSKYPIPDCLLERVIAKKDWGSSTCFTGNHPRGWDEERWKSRSLVGPDSFKPLHAIRVVQRSWRVPARGPLF